MAIMSFWMMSMIFTGKFCFKAKNNGNSFLGEAFQDTLLLSLKSSLLGK